MKVVVSLKVMIPDDFKRLEEISILEKMTLYSALKYPRHYKGDFVHDEECLVWYSVWVNNKLWGTIWFEKENSFDDIATLGIWLSTKETRYKNVDIAARRMAMDKAVDKLKTTVLYLNVRTEMNHFIDSLMGSGFVDVGEGVDMTDDGERFHYQILMYSAEE